MHFYIHKSREFYSNNSERSREDGWVEEKTVGWINWGCKREPISLNKSELGEIHGDINQPDQRSHYPEWMKPEKPAPSAHCTYSRQILPLFPFPLARALSAKAFFSPWIQNIILVLDSCQLFSAFVSVMWAKSCPWRRSFEKIPSEEVTIIWVFSSFLY